MFKILVDPYPILNLTSGNLYTYTHQPDLAHVVVINVVNLLSPRNRFNPYMWCIEFIMSISCNGFEPWCLSTPPRIKAHCYSIVLWARVGNTRQWRTQICVCVCEILRGSAYKERLVRRFIGEFPWDLHKEIGKQGSKSCKECFSLVQE